MQSGRVPDGRKKWEIVVCHFTAKANVQISQRIHYVNTIQGGGRVFPSGHSRYARAPVIVPGLYPVGLS